jgi:hypothetical protein
MYVESGRVRCNASNLLHRTAALLQMGSSLNVGNCQVRALHDACIHRCVLACESYDAFHVVDHTALLQVGAATGYEVDLNHHRVCIHAYPAE